MFASLEVVLVVFVHHIPSLNPKPGSAETPPATELNLSEEISQLISAALHCMTMLPSLCSPAGMDFNNGFNLHINK